ncbi:hypothetical protein DMP16_04670 [Sulfolobus sp. B1]|nr:hypothetical protein DMP16_04670 [Sulfolobus sp. B1]
MYSLKDKVVVVTGSGRGIGRAIAVRLAKEGSLLVVNAKKRIEEMNETINIIKSVGGEAIGVLADVSTREGCETLLKATLERYGVVDVFWQLLLASRPLHLLLILMNLDLFSLFLVQLADQLP